MIMVIIMILIMLILISMILKYNCASARNRYFVETGLFHGEGAMKADTYYEYNDEMNTNNSNSTTTTTNNNNSNTNTMLTYCQTAILSEEGRL